MVWFLLGAVCGGCIGLVFGCCCRVAGEADKRGGGGMDAD